MDTGLMIGFIGAVVTLGGVIVKMAMAIQKMRSDIDNTGKSLEEHMKRNEDQHREFYAIKVDLSDLKADIKVIIDRLSRRRDDTHEVN